MVDRQPHSMCCGRSRKTRLEDIPNRRHDMLLYCSWAQMLGYRCERSGCLLITNLNGRRQAWRVLFYRHYAGWNFEPWPKKAIFLHKCEFWVLGSIWFKRKRTCGVYEQVFIDSGGHAHAGQGLPSGDQSYFIVVKPDGVVGARAHDVGSSQPPTQSCYQSYQPFQSATISFQPRHRFFTLFRWSCLLLHCS